MIELVVFDIAGTTIEEHGAVYVALADAARAYGAHPADADLERWMGADKREAIRALTSATDRAVIERVYLDFRDRLRKRYAEVPPRPLPGVVELLGSLKATGMRIALTTGFDASITTPLLDAVGWGSDVVDVVLCADDVPTGRPAPYLIFRAMEATGTVDVRRVLVAGDTPRDVRAGLNAGAQRVVGVLSGGLGEAALKLDPRVEILTSLAELVV